MQAATRLFTGWGGTNPSSAQLLQPKQLHDLQSLIAAASPGSLVPRGLGRSYGDAAQLNQGCVIDLAAFDQIELSVASGTVTVGAGVSLHHLLQVIVPQGFFLPVSPGTRNVTIGGAIAADVHGKNHHRDGSLAGHLLKLWLVDGTGAVRQFCPTGPTAPSFWATTGGMGLTGVVVKACLQLIPISSAFIQCTTTRFADLDSLMAAMAAADDQQRYSVAWVDCLHPSGRGVLSAGDHALASECTEPQCSDPLAYDPRALASAPELPVGLLNRLTVRAFNAAWYRRAPSRSSTTLQSIPAFFHPLDGVSKWNRIYGPSGFFQYQFAVPDAASALIPQALSTLRSAGAPSFLTVLKRFGKANPAPLSFPIQGWTLAADLPAAFPGLSDLLLQLDDAVAAAGGRLYLAKDARQTPQMLRATYPQLSAWQHIQRQLDPRGVFASDLSVRTGLIAS